MSFTVYISHNVSPVELAQVYALAQEARSQGFSPVIPDRSWDTGVGLRQDLVQKLQGADVVLLFITRHGTYQDWLNEELRLSVGKPVIALVEQGVELMGVPPTNRVDFDRSGSVTQAVELATAKLKGMQLQRSNENLLAGLVIGGLALLYLWGVGGEERSR